HMTKVFLIFILIFLAVIYRQAIFGEKIIFPSNYSSSFYAPWSTQKFPGWDQGIPNKPIGADMIRLLYPFRTFSNAAITAGRFPLWNPYILAGNPHLANFQSAVFYPLNLLFLFLPTLSAWSVLVVIQPFLATAFCYLFLRCFPIKKLAACFGAFAFGFSGFVLAWSQEAISVGHSALWLPLILYGLEKRRWVVAALALTGSILAGYLQTTVYISVLVLVYALYRRVEIKKIGLVFFLAAGLSAIQLVPSLESFSLSARPTATIETVFDTYLLPVTHLVKLIAPDINGNPAVYNYFGKGSYNETVLYIGVVPLVFVALAILRRRKEKIVGFFLTVAAITFLLTSDFLLTRWFLHLPLPLVPTFQPSRIFVLTTFSLAVLAAFGFSSWLENQKKHNKIIIAVCLTFGLALTLMLGYYHQTIWQRDFLIAAKNSILPLIMLGISVAPLIFQPRQRLALLITLVLTVAGQFYFASKYVTLGDKQFLYPAHPIFTYLTNRSGSYDRFIAIGSPILGDFATQFSVYSPEGYDPIFSKRYGQLVYAARDFAGGRLSDDLPRIEVMMSQLRATDSGELVEGMLENQRRLKLLSLLGVRNVFYFGQPSQLAASEMFPTPTFRPQAILDNWQVFEYGGALPRAFLADRVIEEADPQKILDKIFDPAIDLRKTLVLEEAVQTVFGPGSGTAKIITYEPERVVVKTAAENSQMLFLSDNYYPGWKVTVDEVETKIYRADFAFRAVAIPAGEHVVEFDYRPQSFEVGKRITLIFLGLLAGSLLLSARNRHWDYKFGWKSARR
ncbi:YfhO family protein, partial [Candidatus Microgenomates bacterium]|nr:YfhO family protein [Candidatus Microgenomates bacterium]